MLYRKVLFYSLIGCISLISFFMIASPGTGQEDSLPPIVINAQDFPFDQGQSVTMVKQLWGDKNEILFEVSRVTGTKDVQGNTCQVIKSFDTGGDKQEDYIKKDGSSLVNIGTTREKMDKLVPAKNFQFPLKLNAEWTVLDKEISGKKVLITSKVVSQEFVKVPAGIYQSLKIAVTSGFKDETRVENTFIWVVPGIGVVKEIQQIDENQTRIRELVSFSSGAKSLLSQASSIPSGGKTWSGSGKGSYIAFAKHPSSGKTLEQNIEVSYSFTFTLEQQTGLIKGQGEAKINKFENSWGKSGSQSSANFTFIGKKEGETLKFYDGFTSVNPDTPILYVLDHAFRLSAPVSGGSATGNLSIGNKDGTGVKIQWQAK